MSTTRSIPAAAPLPVLLATLLAPALFVPARAEARLPASGESDALPPAGCRSAPCLDGARAFARQRYSEAAAALEDGLRSSNAPPIVLDAYTEMTLLAAVSRQRADSPLRAAGHFQRLASLRDAGRAFYAFKALENALRSDSPSSRMLQDLEARGALEHPFPGHRFVELKYRLAVDGELPAAEQVARTLDAEESEPICKWLADGPLDDPPDRESSGRTLRSTVYAHCLEVPDATSREAFYPDDPRPEDRLTRAEHLYSRVEYRETLAELGHLDFEQLPPDDRCRARFRRGRALYRLKRYAEAASVYRRVVDECDTDPSLDPRIRSLYALGRRHFHLDDYETSRAHFETLLEEYPSRSHADDALMFLGRIARKRDRDEREEKLLKRTLREYPDGDMTHEFVWEHLEPVYRDDAFETFLERLDALDLPARDQEYFSQGRLGYFRGRAHRQLDNEEAARSALEEVWRRYPFSFYGYLSHVALDRADHRPPHLATEAAHRPPDWFFDADWNGRAPRQLAATGLYGLAADLEAGRLNARRERGAPIDDADRWRLAYLYHRAGRYHASHNVPRRLVAGRPWSQPETGRLLRWRIAFPTPHLETVTRATRRYRDREAELSPELPLAIMREESGFVADIESWAGALGLMQLMPPTAEGHADVLDGELTEERLREASPNIRVGVDHLFLLAEQFDSHPTVMAAAYNAGGGAAGSWLPDGDDASIALWVEDIPYRQARHYAKRVMGSYAAYQWLSGSRDLDPAPAHPPPSD